VVNFFDYGPQNSRGFRALKVWLALQHAGARGYRAMMTHDIAMARLLGELLTAHPEFEVHGTELSITTFRYVPPDLRDRTNQRGVPEYLDDLNRALLDASQKRGEVFVSNAVTAGRFLLRACLVNFNTHDPDIRAVPDLLAPLGRRLDAERRPATFNEGHEEERP